MFKGQDACADVDHHRLLRVTMQPFKDDDDIDLFISPSRFSGRTPCAASTRGRIFGEMLNDAKNMGGGKGPGVKGSGSAQGVRKNTVFRDGMLQLVHTKL